MSETVNGDRDEGRTETDPILETRGLTKRFGGLVAVDSVDFRLPPGEIHCLIGPNGAGKSTFFKLLTGTHVPDEGAVRYRGEDISSLLPHERARLGISLKFQNLRVYPELTVRENVRIPAQRGKHRDRLEDRIAELLRTVNLAEKRRMVVDNLSHGEQQWLEIAMAIAIDPDLLLLDEPTAGMTIDETRATGELIQALSVKGLSIVVVEHDVKFVRQIAERVTVLHGGSVFEQGTIEEIERDEAVQRIYLGTTDGESF